jgi:AraC-like DNA-binding protein
MFVEHIPAEIILFFMLYGVTGVVALIACIYLCVRKGNAFAPDVTPPMRLRCWAAAFFAVAALGHVWWYLFYAYSGNIHSEHDLLHSPAYVLVVMLDSVTLLTTIAGTLLAMLQDRQRPIWPAFAAMTPLVVMGALQIRDPDGPFMNIAGIYLLSLYVLFSVYMVFAVRRYGQWLNDNYADLENKKVWLTLVVSLVCLLLFILYALGDVDTLLIYGLHFVELILFSLLLWRVETLPRLEEPLAVEEACTASAPETSQEPTVNSQLFNLPSNIEQQLAEHCVGTQLYLQHDLTLQQLAQAIGTNRSYLSLYFSRQGITYNAYINDLRIDHFVRLYRAAVAAHQPVVAQQLASDSGYRSYSTFSLAFKQRMGQSVTAWMRDTAK